MSKKLNVVKGNMTAIEAAQELIKKQNEKDIQDCVKELQEHQKLENDILEKHGCVKNIQGQFLNDKIQVGFTIAKK